MKRLISLLLAVFLILTAMPALAASGDAVIARNGEDGFEDWATRLCTLGDTVWIEGRSGAYAYDTATGEMSSYPWSDETLAAMNGLNHDENGVQLFSYTNAWFAYDGSVYALLSTYNVNDYVNTVALVRVGTEDGKAYFEEAAEIDTKGLADELDGSIYMTDTVVVNDTLCGLGQVNGNEVVCFLPLDGSAAHVVYLGSEWPSGLTSWNGDLLLTQNVGDAQYAILPFDGDEPGEWQDLPESEDAAQGTTSSPVQYGNELIYASGSALMAFNPETGESRSVASLPFDLCDASAYVTESGLYVSGSFEGVVLRALSREGDSTETLVINDVDNSGAIDDAVISFSNEQGIEVSTVLRSDVLTALLTKSTDEDVIILSNYYDGSTLQAILNRGWARPIESDALTEYVSGMYPAITDMLMQDGQVLGVPFYMYSTTPGVNVGTLTKLGLTIDDVPTSWPELIDWLNSLIPTTDLMLMDGEDADEIRESFVRTILDSYMIELELGTLDSYDTPELRAALEAVTRLDAETLAERNAAIYADEDADIDYNPLFTLYAQGGISSSTYDDEYDDIPLYLSIAAGMTCRVPLQGYVAIINPYSENVEAATRFLEVLAEKDEETSRAMLRSDLNDTVRSSGYETYTAEYDEKIASLEEQLKTAEGDLKETLEEELANAREVREGFENSFWIVSKESLERYRAYDEGVVLEAASTDYSIREETNQYCAGQMTLDEFITAVQKKYDMHKLEE